MNIITKKILGIFVFLITTIMFSTLAYSIGSHELTGTKIEIIEPGNGSYGEKVLVTNEFEGALYHHVLLIVDSSSSVTNSTIKENIYDFSEKVLSNENNRLSIVNFRGTSPIGTIKMDTKCNVLGTRQLNSIKKTLDDLQFFGNTNISAGLARGREELQKLGAIKNTIIIYTDGNANTRLKGYKSIEESIDSEFEQLKEYGDIHIIGYGNDSSNMKEYGKYYNGYSSAKSVFSEIAEICKNTEIPDSINVNLLNGYKFVEGSEKANIVGDLIVKERTINYKPKKHSNTYIVQYEAIKLKENPFTGVKS